MNKHNGILFSNQKKLNFDTFWYDWTSKTLCHVKEFSHTDPVTAATCVCSVLCPTLCDCMDCNLLSSSVHGIFQARILEWVAISSSSGSFQPRDQIHVSCICRWIPYYWATWEAWNECDSANVFPLLVTLLKIHVSGKWNPIDVDWVLYLLLGWGG